MPIPLPAVLFELVRGEAAATVLPVDRPQVGVLASAVMVERGDASEVFAADGAEVQDGTPVRDGSGASACFPVPPQAGQGRSS